MTEGQPLPPLYEALLDPAQVDALFHDLATQGCDVEVLVRERPRRPVEGSPTPPTLSEARSLLASDGGRAIQLRYRFEDTLWWDTLTPTPSGVRLIRVGHDPALF